MTSRRTQPRHRSQAGISLLEVLVAMTLFALVASGVAAMTANSLRATANDRASTAAQMIAQDEIEQVRALEYADIAPSSRSVAMAGTTYSVDRLVTDNDPADGMKTITVQVQWVGPLGARSYEVQTIFTAVR